MTKEEKDFENMQRALMDPGYGVEASKDKVEAKAEKEEEESEDFENEVDASEEDDDLEPVTKEKKTGRKFEWSSDPTYSDQLVKHPNLCRYIGPKLDIFDVTVPAQLSLLNDLMAKTRPEESPELVIINKKENFHEGKWLVLVEYFKVEYKKFLS